MTFCAGCGSPNLDSDATCRVCGRSLTADPTPPTDATAPSLSPSDDVSAMAESATGPPPSATAVADPPAGWPASSGSHSAPDRSAASHATTIPATGVATPSGFESVAPTHHDTGTRLADELPAFMRPAARAAPTASSNESASLISEHDLPEWIRQIAADDARKLAEAQVQEAATAAAAGSSMPSHLGRRALPGETLTSGPASSSWLSRRDAATGAAASAWDVAGAAAPSRPVMFPDATPARPTTPTDALPVAADVVVAESVTAPSRRRRRGSPEEKAVTATREARPTPPEGAARGNQRQVYLAMAIVVALVLAVAMTIL